MDDRRAIVIGLCAGLIWTVALLAGAVAFISLPVFTVVPTIFGAFLAPGLVLIVLIARLAIQRLRTEHLTDDQSTNQTVAIDQRVLSDTIEQLILAICIWPAGAILLGSHGPGVITTLGVSFALTRLAYWIGCHRSPALRMFGFSAGFFPTVLVAIWAVAKFMMSFG